MKPATFKYNRGKGLYEILSESGTILGEKRTAQEAQAVVSSGFAVTPRPPFKKTKQDNNFVGFGQWGVPGFFGMKADAGTFDMKGSETHGTKD